MKENLDFYGLGDLYEWSAVIFARVIENGEVVGYIFVIDPKFGDRAKYKLPAGHRQNGEGPATTAAREFEGETGISVLADKFKYIGKELAGRKYPDRDNRHWKIWFMVDISPEDRNWMNNHHAGNEGEHPHYSPVEDFPTLMKKGKFLEVHYDALVRFGLIQPIE